jgi:hypothetical protein
MDFDDYLKGYHFLSMNALLCYSIGYLFAYVFPIKDENWDKIQPVIGAVVALIVVASSYGK